MCLWNLDDRSSKELSRIQALRNVNVYTSEYLDGRVMTINIQDNTIGKLWDNKDNINPYIDECEIIKVNAFMVSR